MGTSINIFVFVTMLLVAAYWTLPPKWILARQALIILGSSFLLFIYNPRALWMALLITLWAELICYLAPNLPGPWPKRSLWLIMLPMVLNNWVALDQLLPLPTHSQLSPIVVNTATLGLSFYSLKLYMSMHRKFTTGESSFVSVLATVLFYPSFAQGPIDAAEKFGSTAISRNFEWRTFVSGTARLGTGIAKAYVITKLIDGRVSKVLLDTQLGSLDWDELTVLPAVTAIVLSFVRLFFDFSGFTSMAVGVGLMLNLSISENFKAPFLASSIQNFWQRWHLSLSNFITVYLFQPLVRHTGRPRLAIFAAFVIIGLWHEITLGYLLWGLGHGAAMAWYFGYSRNKRKKKAEARTDEGGELPRLFRGFALRTASTIVTIFYVALMSMIASLGTADRIAEMLAALVRI